VTSLQEEQGVCFRSRVDAWLVIVIFAPLLAVIWKFGARLLVAPELSMSLAGALCLAVVGMIAWMFASTSYTVTESELVIRCGPMRSVVPLASIRRVRARIPSSRHRRCRCGGWRSTSADTIWPSCRLWTGTASWKRFVRAIPRSRARRREETPATSARGGNVGAYGRSIRAI